jgi:hypothetical protein
MSIFRRTGPKDRILEHSSSEPDTGLTKMNSLRQCASAPRSGEKSRIGQHGMSSFEIGSHYKPNYTHPSPALRPYERLFQPRIEMSLGPGNISVNGLPVTRVRSHGPWSEVRASERTRVVRIRMPCPLASMPDQARPD